VAVVPTTAAAEPTGWAIDAEVSIVWLASADSG
jgi:hypothetical protein